MKELWKDIPNYGGLYQVSDMGNVRSVNYNHQQKIQNRKPSFNSGGYLGVILMTNAIGKTFRVHRLVAEAFIPNPLNKKEVNHINGIKTDNRVKNLEWCTRSENMKHAFKSGSILLPSTKLSREDVLEIRRMIKTNSVKNIMEKFSVCRSTIYRIVNHVTWKEV